MKHYIVNIFNITTLLITVNHLQKQHYTGSLHITHSNLLENIKVTVTAHRLGE